jgi:hypothetical protein
MDLHAAGFKDRSSSWWTRLTAFLFFAFAAGLMLGALIRAKPADNASLTFSQFKTAPTLDTIAR